MFVEQVLALELLVAVSALFGELEHQLLGAPGSGADVGSLVLLLSLLPGLGFRRQFRFL